MTDARIPLTALERLYRELHCAQTEQLRILDEIPSRGGLAALFDQSIDQAACYENEEAFYPKARKPLKSSGPDPQRTKDVALRLGADRGRAASGWPVPGYRYVDRELRPFRTTGGATYIEPLDNGIVPRAASTPMLDLLLVDDAGQPAIAEVKIGRDQNRAFALVQGLMHAAALSGPAQRRRLSKHMKNEKLSESGPLDVLILEVDPPERENRARFNKLAEDLATNLFEDLESDRLRSVRCLRYDSQDPGWKPQWNRPVD